MARFIATRLTMIPTFDLVAFAGGASIVFLAALCAAYVPSRRAAAVDPAICLRTD